MSGRFKVPVILLLLLLDLASSHSHSEDSAARQNLKQTSDPVSNFFSELGDLILDVDQTIAVHSQPKIARESDIVSQLLKPRSDYFDRIQKNYRDVQKRLGDLIGNTIGFKNTYNDHELSTIPPMPSLDSIKPDYNPFTAAAESRKGSLMQKISKGSNEKSNKKHPVEFKSGSLIPESIPVGLRALGKISKAMIDDIGDLSRKSSLSKLPTHKDALPKQKINSELLECSEILKDPILEQRRKEKCSRIAAEHRERADVKELLEPKRISDAIFSASSKTLDQLSEGILSRSGDSLSETEAETNAKLLLNECSDAALEDPILENIRRDKCVRIAAEARLIEDLNKLVGSEQTSKRLMAVGSKAVDDLSTLIKRSGDGEDANSGGTSRSDSSLDKQVRQLIKDHGSWILDYPLFKLWRQRDRSSEEVPLYQSSNGFEYTTTEDFSDTEPTEVYIPVSTDYETTLQEMDDSSPEASHESPYYRIMNRGGNVMDDVSIVLDPQSLSYDIGTTKIEESEPKETVILAFTSDGVPLKLRLGPEIDNPFQYLHKSLKSAGVSLNIPVESYDDLEPVGKEVLKLGSGILNRAVLINVSNSNELKALLKTLMVSKSSVKTTL